MNRAHDSSQPLLDSPWDLDPEVDDQLNDYGFSEDYPYDDSSELWED